LRACLICTRPDKSDIDQALIQGESNRSVSNRFQGPHGPSPSAVDRHRRFHLGPRLAAVQARREKKFADLVIDIEEDLIRLGAKAEAAGDVRAALLARRERIRLLELSARQSGELRSPGSGHPVTVNVLQTHPARSDAEIERDCRLVLQVLAEERADAELARQTGQAPRASSAGVQP
jgi:hypothetical protein